jgi:hypothetical protein
MSNIEEILMATMKLVTEGFLRHPPDGQAAVGPIAGRMAAASPRIAPDRPP